MTKDLPTLLSYMAEFGYTVKQIDSALSYELFQVDLSSLRLSLSDQTPVIWVHEKDLAGKSPRFLYENLQDVISRNALRRIVIVAIDGDGAALRRLFAEAYQPVAILDAVAQDSIQKSRRPIGVLLDKIVAQLPLSTLSPYETQSPVSGSRFFGRDFEIAKVLSRPDTNFAILGPRRIGKTSMLHQIWRELGTKQRTPAAEHAEAEGQPIVFLDCSALDMDSSRDFVHQTVRVLSAHELAHCRDPIFSFPNFLERMGQRYQTRVVFLLDEIDSLLLKQRGSWDILHVMRSTANQKLCQYIVAGFSEALKEQHDIHSPYFNFAEEIRLGELTRRQASDLIVTPMENLRLSLRNREEVVARIYDETAGLPNLIQYYCTILLRNLDTTGGREISLDSLIDVYMDEGFRSHLLISFETNTSNREKCIVYAVLEELVRKWRNTFSQEFVDDALQRHDVTLTHNELTEACNVLVLAGILRRNGRDYSFTSPIFARVLEQTFDIKYLLRKVKAEGL